MSPNIAYNQPLQRIDAIRKTCIQHVQFQMTCNTGFNHERIMCVGQLCSGIVVIVVGFKLKCTRNTNTNVYNTLYVHTILCITPQKNYEQKRCATERSIHYGIDTSYICGRPKNI